MTRALTSLCLLFVVIASSSLNVQARSTALGRPVAQASPAPVALVQVQGHPRRIPAGFLGLSIEMSALCQVVQLDTSGRLAYERLYRHLGSPVIHVGGRSSDLASWKPNAAASCSDGAMILNKALVNAFFAFIRRTNLKVSWALPLSHFRPKSAVAEAKYVASVAGPRLTGWTLGNEPDLWVRFGDRDSTWTAQDYFQQWSKVQAAVVKAVPNVGFIGPEECCSGRFFTDFSAEAKGRLSALSFHFYAGSRSNLTASYLMSSTPMRKLGARVNADENDGARPDNLPLYLTEVNTFPLGGVPGVSNAFVAALWMTDLLFNAVSLGLRQADVQEIAGSAPYNPIDVAGRPSPLFYAMLLFHNVVGSKSSLLSIQVKPGGKITAYGVREADGSLNVVIVNKGRRGGGFQIKTDRVYRSARSYSLSAPSLTSMTSVTLGGREIGKRGKWSPKHEYVKVHARSATIWVRGHSAVCVNFR